MKLTKYPFALALLALLQATPAQAHYLWIGPANGAAHLCFGEYQEGLREKAGEVAVDTPWPSLYVLHVAPVKGEYQNDAYEAIRHVGTLSLLH